MAYSGTCKCGGNINETGHEVKGLGKAREWFSQITQDDLPVMIEQRTCNSCGRMDKKWRDKDGVLH